VGRRNTAAAMDVQKYYLSEIGFPICMGKWAILQERIGIDAKTL